MVHVQVKVRTGKKKQWSEKGERLDVRWNKLSLEAWKPEKKNNNKIFY